MSQETEIDKSTESVDIQSRIQPLAAGHVGVYSSPCPGGNGVNEDASAVFSLGEDHGILAIADGMGGQPAGEQASRVALAALAAELKICKKSDVESARDSILTGIEQANRKILELGVGAATTIAVVEIKGKAVRTYHAGDSMILLVGQRGKVKMQTMPHSPVGYAVEAGLLDEKEAMHHEERHVVSNMLGASDMRVEIGSAVELDKMDTVLLASDGLFDNMLLDEIVEVIRKGPVEEVMERLAEISHKRMETPRAQKPSKPDDLSFILFRNNGNGSADLDLHRKALSSGIREAIKASTNVPANGTKGDKKSA